MKNIVAFFIIYMIIFVISVLIMAFLGNDLLTSFSAVATSLGNVGPGLGNVGPTSTFMGLGDGPAAYASRFLLSILMWLGRLEIFAGIILFFPETYKK